MAISSFNEEEQLRLARANAPQHDQDVGPIESLLKRKLRGESINGEDAGGYSQVDLRPDWYKTFLTKNKYDQKGPPLTSTAGSVATAGLGAVAQGAQKNADTFAQLPGAKAGDIMNMQRKAGGAGLLSGALGVLLNKKSSDFDTQQGRAVKDASELHKNSKTGASANELQAYLNYDKTQVRNDQLAQRDAIRNAQVAVAADNTSPESRDQQAAGVASGIIKPDEANNLTAQQIKDHRTGFMQTQGQEHGDQKFDRERDRLEAEKLGEEERGELRRIETERRDQGERVRQNFIPQHQWANNTPPSPEVAKQARDFVASQNMLITSATELKEIQNRLAEVGRDAQRKGITSPAAIGQYVDKYFGDEETQHLLARAQLLQKDMVTAMRSKDHLGVLQQFEKAMEEAVNPLAGTPSAFFRGSAPWDAIIDTETKYGRQHKKDAFGLYEEGDSELPVYDQRPAEESVRRFARPEVRRAAGSPGAQTTNVPVGTPAGAQPDDGGFEFEPQAQPTNLGRAAVPPMPADARRQSTPSPVAGSEGARELNGMWTVTMPSGATKPRKLTESQYKMLQQKFGLGAVKRAQ